LCAFPAVAQVDVEVVPLLPADTFAIYQDRQKALIAQQQGDLKEESRYYDQIAFIYWEHNLFEKAAEWYKKSLILNGKLDNLSGMSMINSNLGILYNDMHQYETAYGYFKQTLSYRKMMKDDISMISTLIHMSVVLNNLQRFDESIGVLNEALTLARELNDIEQMTSCYGMLSETYEKAKQPDKAYEYFGYYRSFHEEMRSEKEQAAKKKLSETNLQLKLLEMEKENQDLQLRLANRELINKEEELYNTRSENESLYRKYTRAELEKNLLEKDNLLKESILERQRSEQQQQQLSIIFLSTLLVIILMALLIFIRLYRMKNKMNILLKERNQLIIKQKEEIESQKINLTDSINYALRIQNAALKKNREIDMRSMLDDFFIFFKPAAIVSGDFYWFSQTDKKLVLVAADCTGHGVPGAFMSLIGMNLLNHIVEGDGIFMPDEILLKVNYAIVEMLDQKNNNNFDGMDAAVVTLDFEKKQIYFAGAYRPLLICADDEIILVKGNMASVGGSQELFNYIGKFDLKTFEMKPSMRFYLFSDGFCDQPNENFKRIGSKQFHKMLSQISKQPMQEQYAAVNKFFDNWKQGADQVDDVMVLGFSLKQSI
jgi:serine phosphatase RsbU (regulator of sigma subunit)